MQPLKWQWEKYRLSVIFLKRIQAKSLKFISWGENHGYLWFIFISYVPQNALNQNWDVKGEMSRIFLSYNILARFKYFSIFLLLTYIYFYIQDVFLVNSGVFLWTQEVHISLVLLLSYKHEDMLEISLWKIFC